MKRKEFDATLEERKAAWKKRKADKDAQDIYAKLEKQMKETERKKKKGKKTSAAALRWKSLNSKTLVHMKELHNSVSEAVASMAGGGSTESSSGESAATVRRADNGENRAELRESLEKQLRLRVRREFEAKLEQGFRMRIEREISRKYKRQMQKKLDDELKKIRLSPDETRQALEAERDKTAGLEADLDEKMTRIEELVATGEDKDRASAELALLVREKDMLLSELTLLIELARMSSKNANGGRKR